MRFGMGLGLGLGAQRGAGYTAEAQAYFDACPTKVSTARKAAINQFIISLKASKNGSNQSIWDLTDKLGILANESVANAAINLKYPYLGEVPLGTLQYVTSPPAMYQTNKGIVRNNVGNNHIYTRYKPEGNYNYKIDSATVAIWVLQAETEAYKTNMGTSIAASGNVCLRAQRNPGSNIVTASINSTTFDLTHPLSPETGFFGVVRTSQTKISIFQNTTKLVNQTVNRDALPNSIIALSGIYDSEILYSTKPLCFYFIGGGLTDGDGGQMESLRSAMAAYLTTMGVI